MSIQLLQVAPLASVTPESSRFYANGRRVSRVKFQDLKREAVYSDCFQTIRRKTSWRFYSIAHVRN